VSKLSANLLLTQQWTRTFSGGEVLEHEGDLYIQDIPGGKVNILGGQRIGHSEQKIVYGHVSYSKRFPG
jgi:hypothetical protein